MRTVNRTDIGKRIRGLRDSRRITREEFSEALDITPQFLRDIEAGTKGMSNETLIDLLYGHDPVAVDNGHVQGMFQILVDRILRDLHGKTGSRAL